MRVEARKRKVYVLRIGHRPERDKRVTTHVGLVARAFGADGIIIGDVIDEKVVSKIKDVCKRWGRQDFHVISGINSVRYVREWKGKEGIIVHLTMYGLHIDDVIDDIRRDPNDILVIVGASKVPRFFYEVADFNVAVGNQPHSEIAALAVFLDRLFEGRELHFIFSDAKICIEPSPKGKKVTMCGREGEGQEHQ